MAKFKVGDYVRATVSDKKVGVGDIGKVTGRSHVPYVNWLKHGIWAYVECDLEPWTPKVGERVRLVKDGRSTTGAVGKLATIEKWSDGTIVDGEEYLLNIDPPVDYKTVSVNQNYTRAKIDCFEPAGNEPAPTNVSAQVDAIADEYGPATTSTQPAIVCLIENGQPKPATRPFVHANREAASAEAARLANVNKGHEFGVYVLAESRKDEPPAARYKVGDVVKCRGARDTIEDSQFVGGRWQYSLKRARGIFYDNELYPAKFDHEWQELAANGQRGAAIRIIQDKTGLSVEHARLAVNAWADAA